MARFCARAVALSAALALAAAAALAWRLSLGPAPLGPAGAMIAAAASSALPGGSVEIGGVSLTAGEDGRPGLALRLEDVTVRDVDGRPVFSAPETVLKLRPLPLLIGRFRPTDVVIRNASARLTRAESGAFSFGVGGETDATARLAGPDGAGEGAAAEEGVAALVSRLGEGEAPSGPLAVLESVVLERLALTYDDRSSGRIWTAERADLRLVNGPDGLRATGSIVLPQGRYGTVALRAEGAREAGGAAAFSVSFSGVAPADLAAQIPAVAGMEALEAPLQGRARVAIDGAGLLTAFSIDVRASSGALRLGPRTVELHGGAAAFAFDPATGRFDLTRFRLAGPEGEASGSGAAVVARAADGAARSVVAELELDALAVDAPEAFATPQRFDAGRVSLRARFDPLRIEVAEANLAQGALSLSASGEAARDGEGVWTGAATARLGPVDAGQALALWPPDAAPGARVWLMENLEAGVIDRADFAARVTPDGPQLALTFAFSEAVAHFLRPMPPITGAAGWAALEWDAPRGTPASFGLTLDAGEVFAPGGGAVALAGSTMTLPDVDHPLAQTEIDMRGVGPIAVALELIDGEPLALPRRIGLDPRSVSGDAQARGRIDLPLLKDLTLEQVAVAVSAALTDVSASPPGLDVRVTSDALALRADTEELSLEGAARIDGLAAQVSVREVFAPGPGAPSTFLSLSGGLSSDQLARLGLDLAPYASGRARGSAKLERFAGGATDFDARLDLAGMAIDGAPLDWRKAEGEDASLRLSGRIDGTAGGGAVALSAIALDTRDLSVRGRARLGGDGALRSLDLSRVRLDDRLDATLALTRAADGFRATVGGRLIDLAALGDAAAEGGGSGGPSGPPVTAELAVERLQITGPLALTDARGDYRRAGGVATASISGRVGAASVTAQSRQGPDGETVRLEADDAGELLRAAGLFGDGVGGRLAADARVERGARLRLAGEASIVGMAISDDPALEEMLARADLEAARRGSLRFDLIRAPFVLEGDRVTLGETVAYGPDIGVTIKGAYDIGADDLDLDGVFSPAFALNGALSRVPLLGDLLTGGEGRGLIAFNFSLSGDAADPEISVNPLSVLTPGVLRRIFALEGEAPAAE
ncbi:AsmA-like C-terminal region [Rubrimonas cliftonensis]|uniref:AsmA-like C-terminal region n=1 Tax=Rubrimonas cliftonensis TaxID=89524 RepID=A0A1H4BCT3_9RHOB|nr:AsmA-like C-terminal region [Rubrimonas cliftonensis]